MNNYNAYKSLVVTRMLPPELGDCSRAGWKDSSASVIPKDRGISDVYRFLSVAAGICILLAQTVRAQEAVAMTRLNGIELGIDQQTGSLRYMSSALTGVILDATGDQSGLLDLAYPIKEFVPLRLASRFSQARIVQQDKGLTISYESLGPSRKGYKLPSGAVSALVTVRAADDGRSVIFSCRVVNGSRSAIAQTLFPDLWGLTPSNGVAGTELRFARGVVRPFAAKFRDPESAPPYWDRVGWKQYPDRSGYYSENALRWLDFGGLAGGFSVFQRKWATEDAPEVLTYRAESDPLHLRLAWQHKASLEPGQTWESGEFWLTPHPGGWAKGIEVFRDYVQQVNPPRDLPAHIRDGLGFQTIWMTQAPETDPQRVYFRFRDLGRVAQDALQYGLDELAPWFWNGSYFTMPILSSPLLGSEQELLEGIRKAKAVGVNVAPFVSVHIILNSELSRYGATPGRDDWTYHPDLIPEFRPYYGHDLEGAYIADDNALWQQDVQAALDQWIEKGMSSFTFDQFGYREVPGQKPALIKVIDRVRESARAEDPQSTFGSESITDLEWDTSILDYTWNWLDYEDAGPIVSVLRSPRLNCNIDDSPLAAKKCMAEGLYLNVMPSKPDSPNGTALVSEKPALAAALKDLAILRKQFLPYFVRGHALGDSILSEPTTAFVRAYELPDRLLLFVLNDRADAQQVVFRSDLRLWMPKANHTRIDEFDGQGQLVGTRRLDGIRWVGETRLLNPGEMSELEIKPD